MKLSIDLYFYKQIRRFICFELLIMGYNKLLSFQVSDGDLNTIDSQAQSLTPCSFGVFFAIFSLVLKLHRSKMTATYATVIFTQHEIVSLYLYFYMRTNNATKVDILVITKMEVQLHGTVCSASLAIKQRVFIYFHRKCLRHYHVTSVRK